jgi:Fe-S-cluster containining protein
MSLEKMDLKTVDGSEVTPGRWVPIPCFRCGVCCTCYQPPLLPEDIEMLAEALGISGPECLSRYALKVPIREGYLLRKTADGCIFLTFDDEGRAGCTIYDSRPRACREWRPGLSQPACAEGLARLKSKGQLVRLRELVQYEDQREE